MPLTWNSDTSRYEAIIDNQLMQVDADIFAECEQELRQTYIENGMDEDTATNQAWKETRDVLSWYGCNGVTLTDL